jgi:glutathionylspermidine synthase
MERRTVRPREGWQAKVEALGLVWHTTADGKPYWDEGTYYAFSRAEIGEIETATAELYDLFLKAGQAILDCGLLGRFGIPDYCHKAIRDMWNEEPPALNYGRFDLGYDGKGPPKLFEFNCDTPTSLLEAAVVQWDWKEEVFPGLDQYNSLHDKLAAKWKDIAPSFLDCVHFAHIADDAGEDTVTVAYMRDLAEQAGLETVPILMQDIGWDGSAFADLEGRPMSAIYHLYPWEWLVNEEFGRNAVASLEDTAWIEPIWKMMWSNKAVLPLLWEMFPDHPNLLPAAHEPLAGDYVRKPLLAREGANIEVRRGGATEASTGGDYGEEGFIYQALYALPGEGENRPVVGAWIVDGEPAGMGLREDGLITGNTARFVPHVIQG